MAVVEDIIAGLGLMLLEDALEVALIKVLSGALQRTSLGIMRTTIISAFRIIGGIVIRISSEVDINCEVLGQCTSNSIERTILFEGQSKRTCVGSTPEISLTDSRIPPPHALQGDTLIPLTLMTDMLKS